MRSLLLSMILLFAVPSFAFVDSAMMFELVTTTASQLNELEKLVSNAEKYTERMRQYNELLQDEYFKAERIKYLADEMTAKNEINNLGQFNIAVRELKYSMTGAKELMDEYSKVQVKEDVTTAKTDVEKRLVEQKKKQANSQINKTIDAKSSARANQLTAQNTALIHESQLEMQSTQLDLLQETSTTNKLLAQKFREDEAKELQRKKEYGILGGKP